MPVLAVAATKGATVLEEADVDVVIVVEDERTLDDVMEVLLSREFSWCTGNMSGIRLTVGPSGPVERPLTSTGLTS